MSALREKRKKEKRKERMRKFFTLFPIVFTSFAVVFSISFLLYKGHDKNSEKEVINNDKRVGTANAISDSEFIDVERNEKNVVTSGIIQKEQTILNDVNSKVFNDNLEEQVKYFDVPLSYDLQSYMYEVCEKYNVSPALVVAVIETESNFNPDARGETGDSGLMQVNDINLQRLRDELGVTNIFDPYQNILSGVYILSECFSYTSDENPALMCYNMGYKSASKLWKQGVYSSEYSRKVYESFKKYEAAY